MKIKKVLRFYLPLVKMAIIKKTTNAEDVGRKKPLYSAGWSVN
jgi:hypothetical protein